MKKDLIKIAMDLRKWCEKYNKDYATISYVDGDLIGNVDTKDKDYNKLNIHVQGDK